MKIAHNIKTGITTKEVNSNSIYNIAINALDGSPVELNQFRGQHILFVNVASACGFTPQYKELQQLSDDYKDKLVVIGLPCNQFGRQEQGNPSEIQHFCERNFGVTFLLTEKINVKGSNQHPIYTWLTRKNMNGKKNSIVKWNFQKYLVDREGKLVDYFLSFTKPSSSKITRHL
ncbi:MAG: glutathione peroxidase [Bacteroidota bacterium]